MTTILKRGVSVAAAAIIAAVAVAGAAKAEDKKVTVAIIMPSLDISYWQWVAYGAKTKAQELGMNSIELDSRRYADRADVEHSHRDHQGRECHRHRPGQLDEHAPGSQVSQGAKYSSGIYRHRPAARPDGLYIVGDCQQRGLGYGRGEICMSAREGTRGQQGRHAVSAAGSRERAEIPAGRPGGIQGTRLRTRSNPPDQGPNQFARQSTKPATSSPRIPISRPSTECTMKRRPARRRFYRTPQSRRESRYRDR